MGRFPLQTKIIILYFLKHGFPRSWMESDVAGCFLPCSVHQAVLDPQFNASLLCHVRQFPEHLSELCKRIFHRFSFPRTCKRADVIRPELLCLTDHMLQRFPVLRILDRIAVQTNCTDFLPASGKNFLSFHGKLIQFHISQCHMKINGKSLKTLSDKCRKPFFHPVSRNTCTYLYLIHNNLITPFHAADFTIRCSSLYSHVHEEVNFQLFCSLISNCITSENRVYL